MPNLSLLNREVSDGCSRWRRASFLCMALGFALLSTAASCLTLGHSGGAPEGHEFLTDAPDPTPQGTVGQPYQITLWAVSIPGPRSSVYEWIITGSVPPGLTYCGAHPRDPARACVISGTPTTAGEFKMNVSVIGYREGRVTDRATLPGGLTITVVAP
jgi:hypothetical protein